MLSKTKFRLTGTAVAFAAAGLIGCAETSPKSSPSTTASGISDLAHCYGVNTCKGHNDCKTAGNACSGKASCKGKGFVVLPVKACGDVGGKMNDAWRGKASTAELSHCYDVNVCKGHNDCKTANNACAGKSSCKGQGFVAMSAKTCANMGGKTGA